MIAKSLLTPSTVCLGADQKNPSKLRVTGLYEGNPSVTDGFPSQRTNNTENVPCDDVIMNVSLAPAWILVSAVMR